MLSGRATGVPGALPALELAHAAHGTLEWSSLFESTARRAELGFAVTPRLQPLNLYGWSKQKFDLIALRGTNGKPLPANPARPWMTHYKFTEPEHG